MGVDDRSFGVKVAVQYKKLTSEQRRIKRWRDRRNHLVSKLLHENPKMLRSEALMLANQLMRRK